MHLPLQMRVINVLSMKFRDDSVNVPGRVRFVRQYVLLFQSTGSTKLNCSEEPNGPWHFRQLIVE